MIPFPSFFSFSDYQPMNGVGDADGIGSSHHHQDFSKPAQGLFPSVFNLAADADVTSNATCGQSASDGPEIYCRLVEHVYIREPQCGVRRDEKSRKIFIVFDIFVSVFLFKKKNVKKLLDNKTRTPSAAASAIYTQKCF
jgi:hypothetical protein